MPDNNKKIQELLRKQESLWNKQESLSNEISELRYEIIRLKNTEAKPLTEENKTRILNETILDDLKNIASPIKQEEQKLETTSPITVTPPKAKKSPNSKSDLEKFIGENLINKIGIAITIIGVSIGAKYSIDNDLISPLTRIILGYLAGVGLLGFGIKLKEKYESYSAVLVSGAIAIMYFITFAAYSYYQLFPQTLAFILMLVFTVFTVVAAINYNKQVIAHIGLVGAYAVPFLLSDGSGQVAVLFSYMAIINIGILFLAFQKYWKPLYYAAFSLSWLIYFSWFLEDYSYDEHFGIASTFLLVFFATFYLIFLAYKVLRKEAFQKTNSSLLLSNSFIFYGLGCAILSKTHEEYLGLFTLCNAIMHSIVSILIFKRNLTDKNIFHLISGLVLIFITITIPVQLDGNWVTLLWVSESALLFWIGRTKKVSIYELLSYPMMILAFFSIMQDWTEMYHSYHVSNPLSRITPVLNIHFLGAVLFVISFGFINRINYNPKYPSQITSKKFLTKLVSYLVPSILIFTLYFSVRMEIDTYWKQLFTDSSISVQVEGQDYESTFRNFDIKNFQAIWILNYSLLFFSVLSLFNIKKLQNKKLDYASVGLITLSVVLFLTQGLYSVSELRVSYLGNEQSEYFQHGIYNLAIRYISMVFAAFALGALYVQIKQRLNTRIFKLGFEYLLFTSILWMLSSELLNWMDITDSAQSYKLGLSILWGSYSLLLIAFGIWKNKQHLRIAAIGLFGITLIKLFFYDISHLSTIAKTIVFVSLGILLLIISFLYNKYKTNISDEADIEIN
ncbi:MAG: hypothetical protein ACI93S_000243 [Ancylomarina sp.]|jgi:hypothetical protein